MRVINVRVKATGEIIEVSVQQAAAGNPIYISEDDITYTSDDIEPAETDWVKVLIDAAIAALPECIRKEDREFREGSYMEKVRLSARDAVIYGKELVSELQKTKK